MYTHWNNRIVPLGFLPSRLCSLLLCATVKGANREWVAKNVLRGHAFCAETSSARSYADSELRKLERKVKRLKVQLRMCRWGPLERMEEQGMPLQRGPACAGWARPGVDSRVAAPVALAPQAGTWATCLPSASPWCAVPSPPAHTPCSQARMLTHAYNAVEPGIYESVVSAELPQQQQATPSSCPSGNAPGRRLK